MWEPVGPLPAAVYWRRRALAAASAVAIVFVVTWASTALSAAPDESARTTRAALSQLQPTAASVDGVPPGGGTTPAGTGTPPTLGHPGPPSSPASSGPPAARPTTPSGTTGARTAAATAPAAAPPVSAPAAAAGSAGALTGGGAGAPTTSGVGGAGAQAAAATSEQLRPDETPRPAPRAVPVPVPPTGPVPCTNAMLGVTAEIDRAVHAVAEHPVLRLVITDTSAQPCVRDLDSSRQEIVVWSADGKVRLWSSNDCGNPGIPDLRTLVPGQPVVFAVTWAGGTSTPGCAPPRSLVPAGDYRLVSRLDDDSSPPTPFRLTP